MPIRKLKIYERVCKECQIVFNTPKKHSKKCDKCKKKWGAGRN